MDVGVARIPPAAAGRMLGDRWDFQTRGTVFPKQSPQMFIIHLNLKGKVVVRNQDAWVVGRPTYGRRQEIDL